MENAADALKMAAAILIFIVAIASSFSVFGIAKQSADSVIGMSDKQKYLEAAELDRTLYTSSDAISSGEGVASITTKGDRIVDSGDVISTIYRYYLEKYAVTIIDKTNSKVLARFDLASESLMANYNNIPDKIKRDNEEITRDKLIGDYQDKIKSNLTNSYVTNINLDLKGLYKGTGDYYSPWLGNYETIKQRINAEINGNSVTFGDGKKYEGKKLADSIQGKKIIEITNEIDNSKYLQDGAQTDLLQQYEMPTVEVIYIVN